MNDIKFIRGRGGLGRPLPGKDHVTGIVLLSVGANIPAELAAENNFSKVFSVQEAEDLGIAYSAGQDNLEVDSLRYVIERIYDANPKAEVYIQVANATDSETLSSKLVEMQSKAKGEIRQAVILDPATDFAVGSIAPLQAACDTLEAQHQPLSVIYSANFMGVADTAFTDLRVLDAKNVSVAFGQDGNGKGADLVTAYTKSFTCAGAIAGVLSSAKVNENIAWVGAFNVNKNDTNEFDVLELADGTALDGLAQSAQDAYSTKGYIFLKKHTGISGSFFNDSYTAISASDDYAFIENVRTIDKAVRNTRTFLLPRLNSPLFVNEDGTLTEDTVASFKNDAERALEQMQVDQEVSAFSVEINPEQDVLKTSKLTITLSVVPVGVARNIEVNIGLTVRATA